MAAKESSKTRQYNYKYTKMRKFFISDAASDDQPVHPSVRPSVRPPPGTPPGAPFRSPSACYPLLKWT